jgi:hypothetical protein
MNLDFNAPGRLCGVALLVALIAGCGGGATDGIGGGGDPPPNPPVAPPEVRGWTNPFGSAAVVIGQTGFDQLDPTGTAATPIPTQLGNAAVSADRRLFVASGSRLLVFEEFEAMNGPAAALTIDMDLAFGAETPGGLSAQGPKLVATAAHRVHIYSSAPGSQDHAANPDISVGTILPDCSASSMRQPRSAFLTALGQLIVADTFNNRVLIWSTVPDASPIGNPDVVLGQRRMNTCVENDDDGDGTRDATPSAQTLDHPTSVWSDGVRLVVADRGNHRVLVWDSFPSAADPDSHRASHVLGQETPSGASPNAGGLSASSLSNPFSVDVSAAGELAVADSTNNRVLIWKSIPTGNAQPADYVVGQSDFTHRHANDVDQSGNHGPTPSAKTLSDPTGARFHGRSLIVSDSGNDRVLVWREMD